MFAELPKLFGKAFAIGFFLPAALLLLGLAAILRGFGFAARFTDILSDGLLGVGVSIFAIWLTAIMMMALNRPLVRFLEGYGNRNPFRARQSRVQKHFSEKIQPLIEEARTIEKARAENKPEPNQSPRFSERYLDAVGNFPPESIWVLPTRFGNIMRAFEVYPYVVYGLDAISAWPRLMMILPEQARTQIQESRALLDFAINLLAASVAVTLTYGALAVWTFSFPALWAPAISLCFLWIGRFLLHQAARQWGEEVKSAFDLYRGDLAHQLGLKLPTNIDLERKMWISVNRTMLYRTAPADVFRRPDAPEERGGPKHPEHGSVKLEKAG